MSGLEVWGASCYPDPMHPSDQFLRKLRKLRKELRTAPHRDIEAPVKDAFQSSVPALPEELTDELFRHFFAKLTAGSSAQEQSDSIGGPDTETGGSTDMDAQIDRVEALADVVDLLCEDYDEHADPLDAADWPVIRDAVSAYAVELDMGTVNYIMRLVVDHRALDRGL